MVEHKKECVCEGCPSWKKCGEKIAYCFTGKSKCITEENGCICGGCPVHKREGFKHGYFCTRGSEEVQLGK
ncbi:MAG: DUF2769 domain-containing protein [Candidatus Woesearchaeota archaeon]